MKFKKIIYNLTAISSLLLTTNSQAQLTWTGTNNTGMTTGGYFTCADGYNCTSANDYILSINSGLINLNGVGLSSSYAKLEINNEIKNSSFFGYGINFSGTNYINIVNNLNGILASGTYSINIGTGSVLNGNIINYGTITGAMTNLSHAAILIGGTYYGDIKNYGIIRGNNTVSNISHIAIGGSGSYADTFFEGDIINGTADNSIDNSNILIYGSTGIALTKANTNIYNYAKIEADYTSGIDIASFSILSNVNIVNGSANGLSDNTKAIISNTGRGHGVSIYNVAGSIINYGTITTLGSTGISMDHLIKSSNDYIILNAQNALISGPNGIVVTNNYGAISGNFENSGTIIGTGTGIGGGEGVGIYFSRVKVIANDFNIINNNSGVISAKNYGIYIMGETTINGSILNSGIIKSDELYAIYMQTEITKPAPVMNGNIINNKDIIGFKKAIYFDASAIFAGAIVNNATGTISGSEHSIYNLNTANSINYQGNGTLTGAIHSDGGWVFSNMTATQAMLTKFNAANGANGIKYSNKGGDTQLNLSYTSVDMDHAKIISNIGDLTLGDSTYGNIKLNLTLNNWYMEDGSYLLASSNTQVFGNYISLYNNGVILDMSYYTLRYENGNKELWLDAVNLPDVPPAPSGEVDKINSSSMSSSGLAGARRVGRVIFENQMTDLVANNLKKDLRLAYAQNSRNITYDAYLNDAYKNKKNGFWLQYYNGSEEYAAQGNVSKFTNDYQGFVLGYDRQVGRAVLGVALSYSGDDGKSVDYKSSSKTVGGNIYGGYSYGKWFALGNFGYLNSKIDTDIYTLTQTPDQSGYVLSAEGIVGRMFMVQNFIFDLYGKYDYAYTNIEKETSVSNVLSLGGDLKYAFKLGNNAKILPTLFYEIGYELSDNLEKTFEVSQQTGIVMMENYYDLGDLTQRFGAKINYVTKNGSTVGLGFEMDVRENYESQEFRIDLGYRF